MIDQKLENTVLEISELLTQQDSIKESIKDICETFAEDSEEFSKADVKKIAEGYHKNNVSDQREKMEKVWEAAEKILEKN